MTFTNHPGAASPSERDFLEAYPSYESTRALDQLRRLEYARIDREGHVYLDFTGGSLYGDSQVHRHCEMLRDGVFGNPHSSNPSSIAATELVERTRRDVLRWFNASEDEYVVVFTANASNALKLVGESYPFERGDNFLLTFDNHNSVNGIREFDRAHGAKTTYIPMGMELRVDESRLDAALEMGTAGRNNLFAYPAQSNFSACIIRSNGSTRHMRRGGTSSSMPRPSFRRIVWTSRGGTPTSWRCRSTRCSATRPEPER